jgi:hypothetical protein
MWKRWIHPYLAISVVLGSVVATSSAQSQGRGDPIGELIKTSTFSSTERINVGKSSKIKLACFFREEGDSHKLDIGMSTDGAFIRVERGDEPLPTASIPKPPLQIFAGKELTKLIDGNVKSTGEYAQLQIYDGAVDYVPNLNTKYGDGFVLVTKGDAKSFFEMAARARGDFIVVQSVSETKKLDVVANYHFKASAISALLSCAKKHIQ